MRTNIWQFFHFRHFGASINFDWRFILKANFTKTWTRIFVRVNLLTSEVYEPITGIFRFFCQGHDYVTVFKWIWIAIFPAFQQIFNNELMCVWSVINMYNLEILPWKIRLMDCEIHFIHNYSLVILII